MIMQKEIGEKAARKMLAKLTNWAVAEVEVEEGANWHWTHIKFVP